MFGIEFFNKFYSLYRGIVVDNQDPSGHMRLQVIVPTVTGRGNPQWAFPRNIFAGENYYIKTLPDVGDGVWVEFERGKMTRPIWSLMHPQETKVPLEIVEKDNIFFQTKYGHTIEIEGENIIIKHGNLEDDATHTIKMGPEGITIKHKDEATKITLQESLIKLNEGANEGIIIGSKLQQELDKLHNYNITLNGALVTALASLGTGGPIAALNPSGTGPTHKPIINNTLNEKVTH